MIFSVSPGDGTITLTWDVVPEGTTLSSGYVMCVDRLDGVVVYNLSVIEAAKKYYVIKGLVNGRNYMTQYTQLMNDSTQISSVTKECIPGAAPSAVVIDTIGVEESSPGFFTVTVSMINPNLDSSSTIHFNLAQAHEDWPSIENDDPNAAGGVDVRDDILSYTMLVDGMIYVLHNVPRAHYHMKAVYKNALGASLSNSVEVFAYVNPGNVTVVATSGQANKLPFTVSALDNPNSLIEKIRVTLYLDGLLLNTIDLTNGNGWSKDGSTITGSGEFTGLDNDVAYMVEAVGITANVPNSIGEDTDNMVSSTVGTSSGVPHSPTNAAATISFTPSNGVATTGYTIALADSTKTNYFEVVYTDITGEEVYRANNITANSSSIQAAYLFDGLKVYATIKDPILSHLTEFWLSPELQSFSGMSLYAHTEIESERLNIETKPDPVYELQLFSHNRISFRAAWNPNTEPDYFTITSDNLDPLGEDVLISTTLEISQPSGSVFQLPFYMLQEGTEYTLNVFATNATDSSTKKSITFMYETAPPVLSSTTLAQDGYGLQVSLLGVVPTTSYWNDGRAVANVYVNDELRHIGVSVDELYYISDLAYDDVVRVSFKHVAFYSLYEPLATRHNTALTDEYSEETTQTVTMMRHPATFSGLSWTQNSEKLPYGTLSWTPPELAEDAVATYAYTTTTNGVTSVSVPVSLGDSVSVQYLAEYTLTLTATVVYNGATTTHSETIESFIAVMPELTPTITYAKIDPGIGIPGVKEVAYSFTLNNNYTYVSAKVKYSNDGDEYEVLAPPLNRFTLSVPGSIFLWFKITGSLTNLPFAPVTNETDWIPYDYSWGVAPTITLTSAERISGGSKIGYTVSNNGDYVKAVAGIVIPATTDFTATSISFTKLSFDWTNTFESATFEHEFNFEIFPNLVADKDDISILLFAFNDSGSDQFEQNICPVAELPSSVEIIHSTIYDDSNRFITFVPTSEELASPDHFSYYMFRTSDNVIVLESTVLNNPSSEGVFYIEIADYVNRWSEYTFKVRAQNSAGVSLYETVTFTYGSLPPPVTEVGVVNTTLSLKSFWTLETTPVQFYVLVTTLDGVDVFENTILVDTASSGDTFTAKMSGLVGGTSYIARVQSQNSVGNSQDVVYPFTYFQAPNQVEDITVINTTMYFNTSWTLPRPDKFYFYVVGDEIVDSGDILLSSTALSGDTVSRVMVNLVSGTSYTVYVVSKTDEGGLSDPVGYMFDYVQGPDPVSNIQVVDTALSFEASWTTTIPTHFHVRVVGNGVAFVGVINVEASSSGDTFTIFMNGLVSGTVYTASVQAQTNDGGVSDFRYKQFTYYLEPGAITNLYVNNITALFNPHWDSEEEKPDTFQFYVRSNGIDIDSGNISVPAASGNQVTKVLQNLVSGTTYTLGVQPQQDSVPLSDYFTYQFTYYKGPNQVTALSATDYIFSFSASWSGVTDIKPDRFYWSMTDSVYGIIYVGTKTSGSSFSFDFASYFSKLVGVLGGTPYTLSVYAQSTNGGVSDTTTQSLILGALPEQVSVVEIVGSELSFLATWFEYAKITSVDWYIDSTRNGSVSIGTASSGSRIRVTLPSLALGNHIVRLQSVSTTGFKSDYVYKEFTYGSKPDEVYNLKVVSKKLSFNSSWNTINPPSTFYWSVSGTAVNGTITVGSAQSGSEFSALLTIDAGSYTMIVEARNLIGTTTTSVPFTVYSAPNSVYRLVPVGNTLGNIINPTYTKTYSLLISTGKTLMFTYDYITTTKPDSFTYAITSGTTSVTGGTVTTVNASGSTDSSVTLTSLVPGSTYTGSVTATNTGGSSLSTPISSFVYGTAPSKVDTLKINFSTLPPGILMGKVTFYQYYDDWDKPSSIRIYIRNITTKQDIHDTTISSILTSGSKYTKSFTNFYTNNQYDLTVYTTNAVGTVSRASAYFYGGSDTSV